MRTLAPLPLTRGVGMMIKRYDDWQTRLTEYVLEWQRNPQPWTDVICTRFAADGVKAMTGKDPLTGYRRYRTRDALTVALKKAGYSDPLTFLSDQLEEIAPGVASPGDLAWLSNEAFGIFQGQYIYTVTPGGVTLVDAGEARKAFKVPGA